MRAGDGLTDDTRWVILSVFYVKQDSLTSADYYSDSYVSWQKVFDFGGLRLNGCESDFVYVLYPTDKRPTMESTKRFVWTSSCPFGQFD